MSQGTVPSITGGTDLTLSITEFVRHGELYRAAQALTSCHTKGCFPATTPFRTQNNRVLWLADPALPTTR